MNKEKTIYNYLVEVAFEQVIVENNGLPNVDKKIDINTEIFSFSDEKKSVAKMNAQKFFDKTLRYGLERSGGSIVKSVITPNSIKNIGIIDFNLYQEEQRLMQEEVVAAAEKAEAVALEEAEEDKLLAEARAKQEETNVLAFPQSETVSGAVPTNVPATAEPASV